VQVLWRIIALMNWLAMILQCNEVELDTECFSITRDGQSISIAPKVFDLLVFLMSHRDRLITREQLFDELWPGRVVLDSVLSNEIKHARAVLGDDGEQQKYIKTVRGRGYRFVGDVHEIETSVDHIEVAGKSAKSPVLRNSIAVLPFENRSQLEEDAYFTDGFHDELITHISRIKDLATISRTSVMSYRDSSKSMRAIGSELNAAHVIEGGVQRAGKQIRINVQLIDSQEDAHIWAETYTRELSAESVFAIQSEIALAVAAQLKAMLSPQEQQDLSETPTRDMAALEAFFRGRVSYGLATSKGFSAAIEHLQQAINLDPGFAEAHAQLGMALLEKVHFGGLNIAAQNALAEMFITQALMLKPELSEAYEALAFLERHRGNTDASEAAYEKALALNPNNTSALRMYGFFKSWDCEEPGQAISLINRARLLDPQNHHTLTLLGQALMELERFDEARIVLNAAIDAAPSYGPAYQTLGQLYSWKLYQHDKAIRAYQRAYHLDSDVPWTIFFLGAEYEELGEIDKAVHFYERYLKLSPGNAFAWIVSLKLHRIRGEHEAEKLLLKQIMEGVFVIEPWHDLLFLGGFDARYAHPKLSVELFEAFYPELKLADPDLGADTNLFKLAIVYATMLHLSGEKGKAGPLTKKILEILPTKSRYRWRGIGMMDAWLHVSMGDDVKAIQALREWRDLGGCIDLTQARIPPNSLSDNPEFQVLNNEILAELAEQRGSLARMEAAGELAPVMEEPSALTIASGLES
jgi:TolB-like protein/Tfp pilus assembly protein PilF